MYRNKSQMSWKPNSRTFIALAPCVWQVGQLQALRTTSTLTTVITNTWISTSLEQGEKKPPMEQGNARRSSFQNADIPATFAPGRIATWNIQKIGIFISSISYEYMREESTRLLAESLASFRPNVCKQRDQSGTLNALWQLSRHPSTMQEKLTRNSQKEGRKEEGKVRTGRRNRKCSWVQWWQSLTKVGVQNLMEESSRL